MKIYTPLGPLLIEGKNEKWFRVIPLRAGLIEGKKEVRE